MGTGLSWGVLATEQTRCLLPRLSLPPGWGLALPRGTATLKPWQVPRTSAPRIWQRGIGFCVGPSGADSLWSYRGGRGRCPAAIHARTSARLRPGESPFPQQPRVWLLVLGPAPAARKAPAGPGPAPPMLQPRCPGVLPPHASREPSARRQRRGPSDVPLAEARAELPASTRALPN